MKEFVDIVGVNNEGMTPNNSTKSNRINEDKFINDFKSQIDKGKRVIGVLDRKITKSDGTEMYEYIGMNATTLAGTNLIVNNTIGHLNTRSNKWSPTSMDSKTGLQSMKDNKLANHDLILSANEELGFIDVDTLPDNPAPRKIIGYMLADDGAVGSVVKVVDRKHPNFDFDRLIPLRQQLAGVEQESDIIRHMDITDATWDSNNHYYAMMTRTGIGRDAVNKYFIKLANFQYEDVTINNDVITNDNLVNTLGLDVRSKVTIEINFNGASLAPSNYFNNTVMKNSENLGAAPTATVSSFMLVAGRETKNVVNSKLGINREITTYTDLIVTNRINFIEIPLQYTTESYLYTLYYV